MPRLWAWVDRGCLPADATDSASGSQVSGHTSEIKASAWKFVFLHKCFAKKKQVELCYGEFICYRVIFTWWVYTFSPWPTLVNMFPESCFLSCCETVGQEINSVTDYPESSSPGGLSSLAPPTELFDWAHTWGGQFDAHGADREKKKIYIYI